ncbi:MAG: hypothetical protein A2156_09670 [Deltaproteobacteria bacterium RBG_16_48_10]|nr:MAG: hypothetical protein A2156_09670 [Deltaproteobacteria bacterium RBG_16_48_10]
MGRCSPSPLFYKIDPRGCSLKPVFGYALREIAYHLRIHSTTVSKMISEGQPGEVDSSKPLCFFLRFAISSPEKFLENQNNSCQY